MALSLSYVRCWCISTTPPLRSSLLRSSYQLMGSEKRTSAEVLAPFRNTRLSTIHGSVLQAQAALFSKSVVAILEASSKLFRLVNGTVNTLFLVQKWCQGERTHFHVSEPLWKRTRLSRFGNVCRDACTFLEHVYVCFDHHGLDPSACDAFYCPLLQTWQRDLS